MDAAMTVLLMPFWLGSVDLVVMVLLFCDGEKAKQRQRASSLCLKQIK
jgi:hypothetical protein